MPPSELGPGSNPAISGATYSGGTTGPDAELRSGKSEAIIDRINVNAPQLATTVRVPVRLDSEAPVPVLVGSLGPAASADDQAADFNGLTYLIVAVSRQ